MLKLIYLNRRPKQSLTKIIKFKKVYKFKPNDSVPATDNRNILITAALPYVNNTPHLGNIIGAILSADAYARYCRMRGYNTLFVCGTDQYGTTTQVKALKQKVTPKQICDKYYAIHKQIYDWFQIQFDYFGRTSNPMHTQITTQIFKAAQKHNYFQKQSIKQFYCQNCKISLADRYVVGNCFKCGQSAKGDQCDSCNTLIKDPITQLKQPKCSICGTAPITKQSNHLYFKLNRSSNYLHKWLFQEDGMKYWTNNAKAVTKAWISAGLQDRCITRDLNWGVPVPQQSIQGKKVFYVWFQAPIGYISITANGIGNKWRQWWIPEPKTKVQLNQFMGKDNIAFHSVLFPATLNSTQVAFITPYRLSVTQYLMYEGGKFSKSNNIGVFGDDCQKTGIKSDIWRYFLLVSRPETYDNEFTWEDLAVRNKKDLMNVIGNMCNRIMKYTFSTLGNQVPQINKQSYGVLEHKLIQQFAQAVKKYCDHMQKTQLKAGAQMILQMGQILNKYIQQTQFWSKKSVAEQRNNLVVGVMMRILEFYCLLLRPYLPQTSDKIIRTLSLTSQTAIKFRLDIEPHVQFKQYLSNQQIIKVNNEKWSQIKLNKPQILFEDIPDKKIKQMSSLYGSHKN